MTDSATFQVERIATLERALAFYADERNYDSSSGAPGVHLREVDKNDPSRWWPEPVGWRDDRGTTARLALAGRNFNVPWHPEKPPAIITTMLDGRDAYVFIAQTGAQHEPGRHGNHGV